MPKKKIVAIISNAPSPYRVDHYKFLQDNYPEFTFWFVYARKSNKSEIRQWDVSTESLKNVIFLPCYMFLKKGKYDDRQIFITHGVGKVLKQINPDVVVSMEYNPTSIQAVNWCKRRKIPYVSHTDGTLLSERNIGKIQKIFRRYVIKNATCFIASSTKAKEKVQFYGTNKPIYISYISADLDKYYYYKNSSKNRQIICVGSLIKRKGIDLLLNAIAELDIDVNAVIAGAGYELDSLKAQVKSLGIDKKVEFVGYKQRNEVQELYKASDLFVLPTREDCYGLVILEAMACSLPVVTSKYADGSYDLIRDGVDGYIVDPENSKEFAASIKRVFNENNENVLGQNAFNDAKRFDFKRVSVNYVGAIKYALRIE